MSAQFGHCVRPWADYSVLNGLGVWIVFVRALCDDLYQLRSKKETSVVVHACCTNVFNSLAVEMLDPERLADCHKDLVYRVLPFRFERG